MYNLELMLYSGQCDYNHAMTEYPVAVSIVYKLSRMEFISISNGSNGGCQNRQKRMVNEKYLKIYIILAFHNQL